MRAAGGAAAMDLDTDEENRAFGLSLMSDLDDGGKKGKKGGKGTARRKSSESTKKRSASKRHASSSDTDSNERTTSKKRTKKRTSSAPASKKKTKDLFDDTSDEEEQPAPRIKNGILSKMAKSSSSKGKGKQREIDESDSEDDENEADELARQLKHADPIEAERLKHISNRWRKGAYRTNPEMVPTVNRKTLELMYNPLIPILGIKLTVAHDDEGSGDSLDGYETNSAEEDNQHSSDDDYDPVKSPKAEAKPVILPPAGTSSAEAIIIDDDHDPTTEEEPEPEPEVEEVDEEELARVARSQKLIAVRAKIAAKKERDKANGGIVAPSSAINAGGAEASTSRSMLGSSPTALPSNTLCSTSKNHKSPSKSQSQSQSQGPKKTVSRKPTIGCSVQKERPKFPLQHESQLHPGPLEFMTSREIKAAYDEDKIMTDKVEEGEERLFVPEAINRHLRDYQREGAKFLARQYVLGLGGILADDMGLGKTIQVIAFLSALMRKTGTKVDKSKGMLREDRVEVDDDGDYPPPSHYGPTALIVCPASVIDNWSREFKTWSYIEVGVYKGSAEDKKHELRQFNRGYYDVLIAGIETARDYSLFLKTCDFTVIIVDEAHRLKNPTSVTTKAMMDFSCLLRYGLTGTPVQNDYGELHTLLNWANPGSVGSPSQWNLFIANPLLAGRKANATADAIILAKHRADALAKNLLPEVFLRRTKDVIADQLPNKKDLVVLCPLTELQRTAYNHLLMLPAIVDIRDHKEPCSCGSTDANGRPFPRGDCCRTGWSSGILRHISLLQKVSNHLALIYPNKADIAKKLDKYEQDCEWVKTAFPNGDHTKRYRNDLNHLEPNLCGKWQVLAELLDIWRDNGDKVLIFTMSLQIISLISNLLQETDLKHLILSGSTPQGERLGLVDKFNDDPSYFCFLISTRAGGVGLNLTAANKVVIFDPNWNPSHDLQAMDRAYRFGQKRDVEVYRLVGAGTLEELVYNRQQHKRALANVAYTASNERRLYQGEKGTAGSLLYGVENIFRNTENIKITQRSIEDCDLSELSDFFESMMKSSGQEKLLGHTGSLLDMGFDDDKPEGDPVVEKVSNPIDELLKGIGAFTTVSDSVIGGSKLADWKTKEAIRSKKAERERPQPAVARPFDALARGAKHKQQQLAANGVKQEAGSQGADAVPAKAEKVYGDFREQLGLPRHVKIYDLMEASGIVESHDISRWFESVDGMSNNQRAAEFARLANKWKADQQKQKS